MRENKDQRNSEYGHFSRSDREKVVEGPQGHQGQYERYPNYICRCIRQKQCKHTRKSTFQIKLKKTNSKET